MVLAGRRGEQRQGIGGMLQPPPPDPRVAHSLETRSSAVNTAPALPERCWAQSSEQAEWLCFRWTPRQGSAAYAEASRAIVETPGCPV